MKDPKDSSHIHEALTQVRIAHRLLNAYYRRLFDLVSLVRDAVVARFGPLPAAVWKPTYFNSIPRHNTDPTERWIYDFVPLQWAFFQWSTSAKPAEGSLSLWIYHDADDALSNDPKTNEPDPATFPPAEVSRTTLSVCVAAVRKAGPSAQLSDWNALEKQLNKAPEYKGSHWEDSRVHVITTGELTVAISGFKVDAVDVATRAAIQERLIALTLELLEQARG